MAWRPLPTEGSVRYPGTFTATRYGVSYEGQALGCGSGVYRTDDTAILAAPPDLYGEWPCGTKLRVVNLLTGGFIEVYRLDSCPGCGNNHIDLSEAGISQLCGWSCDIITGLEVYILQ